MTSDAGTARVTTILRGTQLWSVAPEETLADAAGLMQHRRFDDGAVLIRQGAPGSALHLITSGTVEVRVDGGEGKRVVVATLEAGQCVGEMSLLTGDPASADVVAVGEIETLALSSTDFAAVVASDPTLLRRFVTILSQRLSSTDVAVSRARAKQQDLTEFLREADQWDDDLVGKSPAVRKLRRAIVEHAPSNAPVLVRGEDGTGRELVARLLHRGSLRGDELVIGVDCALIAETEWGDKLIGARGASGTPLGYLDLAAGGTLVLKNLERLPEGVQRRLVQELRSGDSAHDVRLLATVADGAQRPCKELLEAFSDREIYVPPLRERKRDIPILAAHLLAKHASRLGKHVRQFDDQAITRLVSYDFRIANDRELAEAVERAVMLTEGDTIDAETIFLGPPPPPRAGAVNLFALPGVDVRRLVTALPRIARVGAALFFALLLALAFLGPSAAQGNLVTTLVWSLWWPGLALSFFFFGRAWCAVCPMGVATTIGDRFRGTKRRIPAWLKKHDVKIAMAGLFLIVLAEEATGMRHSPVLTGVLLLVILTGAIVSGFLYPRRTWCRHMCPLGGIAGVCSTSGLIELRPTFDVCSAQCVGHSCFKGDEHVAGCPMFNHVMFVDTNQHCVLCMNCVKSCPNDSPQLNLRLPGREIWGGTAVEPSFGLFVLLLAGLLGAMASIQRLERVGADFVVDHRFLVVFGVLSVGAALPLLLAWPLWRDAERTSAEHAQRFWRRVAAMAPLITAGFVTYQLEYLPGASWLTATLEYGSDASSRLSFPVLDVVRFGVLSAGLLTTAVILWRAERPTAQKEPACEPRRLRDLWPTAAMLCGWAGLLALMLLP